jgi:hypothetical protein
MTRKTIENIKIDKDKEVTPKGKLIYNTWDIEALRSKATRKGDLPILMGIADFTFDTAVPQNWLDDFVEQTGLSYDMVLSTTFWLYHPDTRWGVPISACEEVDSKFPERPFLKFINLS